MVLTAQAFPVYSLQVRNLSVLCHPERSEESLGGQSPDPMVALKACLKEGRNLSLSRQIITNS